MTENENILSADPRQAMEEMLKLTEELTAKMEVETNAVASNDGTTFSMNEMDKEQVSARYTKAAAEFHDRLHQFEGGDKALVEKLKTAQASLGQSTKNNLSLLEKLQG